MTLTVEQKRAILLAGKPVIVRESNKIWRVLPDLKEVYYTDINVQDRWTFVDCEKFETSIYNLSSSYWTFVDWFEDSEVVHKQGECKCDFIELLRYGCKCGGI